VEALCAACALEPPRTAAIAAALEQFHLASLLLDDLPCMDDAQTRRGLTCTHRVYGESFAILAALAFINRAYFLVWDALKGTPAQAQGEANALLDACLGLNGILNGQALDLAFASTDRSAATIERIALLKTGSLLRLSMLLPAISGGIDPAARRLLRRLADLWGCLYQLLDDFKDVEWGQAASGKTPLRDVSLGRPNQALALGREQALARMRQQLSRSRQLLDAAAAWPALAAALEPFHVQLEQAGAAFLEQCAA
jgi:geranylgeranyl pyrophosphate synthase